MPTPTNPYYQRAFAAVAGTLARAKSLLSEFVLIQIGFDRIKASIDTIQNNLGPTKYQAAASDLTTDLVAADPAVYWHIQAPMRATAVTASLLTASTSGAVEIDIKLNGVSMLTTALTIDQDEKTSLTAAVPAVIDATKQDLVAGDEIQVEIVDGGTGAKGLVVAVTGEIVTD